MPDPRLYLDERLAEGALVRVSDGQGRKLTQTLRLGAGAPVRVFNARDGEWRAVIERTERTGLVLHVSALLRAPFAARDLDLVFAPVKRDAVDLMVEKATELGVRRLRPVITRRTIVETVRLDRFKSIAREAAEQTERFDLPEVFEPQPLAKALDGWDADRPLIFADEAGDDPDAAWGGATGRAGPLLDRLQGISADKLALLIGPEGGFAPEERALLRAQPYVIPVSLGPRILRAETAAIAALAVIQAAWGDWPAGPRA